MINLTVQYFFTYLVLWIFITVKQEQNARVEWMFQAMEAARSSVQLAPLLAVLFVAVRMRALQISNNRGAPQGWAQNGMYACTWSVAIQFTMCLLMMFFTDKVETDGDGNIKNNVSNKYGKFALHSVRWLALLLLYGGIVTVIVSVFVITKETALSGHQATMPQPPGLTTVPGVSA